MLYVTAMASRAPYSYKEFVISTPNYIFLVRETNGYFIKTHRVQIHREAIHNTVIRCNKVASLFGQYSDFFISLFFFKTKHHLDFSPCGKIIILTEILNPGDNLRENTRVRMFKKQGDFFLYEVITFCLGAFGGFLSDGSIVASDLLSKNYMAYKFLSEDKFDEYCMATQSGSKKFHSTFYIRSHFHTVPCLATLVAVIRCALCCEGSHAMRLKEYGRKTIYINFPGGFVSEVNF